MITVYSGAVAPEALSVTITRGRTDLDLSNVASAEFKVKSADGAIDTTWSADVSGISSTQLTATHVFASDGTDVASPMVLRVMPYLTLKNSGGIRRCVPFTLQVLE